MSCQEVEFILNGTALYERDYPQCWAEGPTSRVTHVAVEANLSGLGIASALRQTAAMGTWVALWIHAIGWVDAYSSDHLAHRYPYVELNTISTEPRTSLTAYVKCPLSVNMLVACWRNDKAIVNDSLHCSVGLFQPYLVLHLT